MTLPQSARITTWESPLGTMVLAGHDDGLLGVWFEHQKHFPNLNPATRGEHPVTQEAQAQLAAYFASRLTRFDLPLDIRGGTAFQQVVWRALGEIASGVTISYSELGQRIHKPSAVRAVAAAVGRNPLSIVLPCHRILGRDGSLTGYAGGLERKSALLELEQRKP